MTDAIGMPSACASCGRPLSGDYCSSCGEEAFTPSKLTVRHFLTHTFVQELFNFDGKIWRTLRLLLFRPGFLALEYAAGRRRPYVNPLRVLITAIIVYVLATQGGTSFTLNIGFKLHVAPAPMSLERSVAGTIEQIDRFGILEQMFAERYGPSVDASTELRSRFNRTLNGFATPLSFMAVFFVAATLYACFHRRRPLLVEHMVFSMHYYSTVLLWLLVPVLAFQLGLTRVSVLAALAVLNLVMVWLFVSVAIAVRRFYFPGDRRRWVVWPAATGVALVVYLLNSAFITAVQFAGVAFAIARL